MRSPIRTLLVLALAAGLVALFLSNVDLRRVGVEIARARPAWLAVCVATMPLNLAIRSRRWQYLLEPLGPTTFGGAFRATAVGFAASTVLPARAGEVIRPYFLARQSRSRDERMSTTGAFATIVLERLLDVVTVLVFLALFVFFFGDQVARANPSVVVGLTWAAGAAAAIAAAALATLFVVAGHPERLGRTVARLDHILPARLARLVASLSSKFAEGLGAIRRPRRLVVALAWSFPLWISIGLGTWAVAMAFRFAIPFVGSFLLVALLVIGVAVPTPGAVGGFHEAFRIGATMFYGVPDAAAVGAAIVLHALSVLPALLLGSVFAAQEGLNFSGMQRLADQAGEGRTA